MVSEQSLVSCALESLATSRFVVDPKGVSCLTVRTRTLLIIVPWGSLSNHSDSWLVGTGNAAQNRGLF